MSFTYKKLLPILLLSLAAASSAQEYPSQKALQDLMMGNWERIEDYEVDIKLELDIPGFRMPSRNIHYMYKAPNLSKVEVKGFAIVPKQGIQPFFTFLRDSVSLQVVSDSLVKGESFFEVTLQDTFMNEPGTINFLVNQKTGNISEAWVIHDGREFFRLNSEYDQVDGIYLPTSTSIRMTFPPDFKNLQRLGKKPTEMRDFDASMTDEWLNGSIKIQFKNYKVNRGIPDYKFEDQAEETIQD
jgi:hypothetical protein